jgi:hypothetical protein
LPGSDLTTEPTDQGAHGIVAVAQSRRDILHRLLFHEYGAECFVVAVRRLGGAKEESSERGIVHGAASGCGVFFRGQLLLRPL